MVGTLHTNMGAEKALADKGISLVRTDIGDHNVARVMRENGYALGGEQSGHIIFSKYATTGDGILTSLKVMEVMLARKQTLSKLAEPVTMYPQTLINVRVKDRQAAPADPEVQAAIRHVEEVVFKSDKFLATVAGDMKAAKALYDRGYGLVVPMSDSTTLAKAAKGVFDEFHSLYPNR